VVDAFLDRQQILDGDPACTRPSVGALDAPAPGVFEREGRSLAKQVDAGRGDSELEDFVFVRRVQQVGAAELAERGVRASEVVGLGVEPDVDVLREPRLRVIDEGQTTDDQ